MMLGEEERRRRKRRLSKEEEDISVVHNGGRAGSGRGRPKRGRGGGRRRWRMDVSCGVIGMYLLCTMRQYCLSLSNIAVRL